ncbi:MAG: hypothetical protein KDC00_13595 [Flavobacteriales bacterium]|nr:hypothetical protein [Flavobacteriales bacterium]
MEHTLRPTPRGVLRALFGFLAVLLVLHCSVIFSHLVLRQPMPALSELCDMDVESNLPTLFNVLLFLAGAFLFYTTGLLEQGKARRPWMLLAMVFVFLGLDEGSQIHERLMLPMLRLMNDGGYGDGDMGLLFYAWTIPYGLAALILLGILVPWLLRLDGSMRKGFILSGALFVTGAVVLESISGSIHEGVASPPSDAELTWLPCSLYPASTCYLYDDLRYIVVYTLEELAEMSGLILCIGVLLRGLQARNAAFRIRFGKD